MGSSVSQIADKNPDLILISKLLPKFSSFTVQPALFTLPGYSSYLNFNADCVSSNLNIRGVGLFASQKIKAPQVFFNNATDCNENVWVKIKMQGSDTGCIYAVLQNPSAIAYHHFVTFSVE